LGNVASRAIAQVEIPKKLFGEAQLAKESADAESGQSESEDEKERHKKKRKDESEDEKEGRKKKHKDAPDSDKDEDSDASIDHKRSKSVPQPSTSKTPFKASVKARGCDRLSLAIQNPFARTSFLQFQLSNINGIVL
jgi:hypothetical protein